MENKGKSRARDERKNAAPQRTQILEQGVGDGGKTSSIQISHSEISEMRRSEVGEAQRWGLVELAPRLERQSRAWRTLFVGESCEMHEMI